jgi:hypothetical protein
MFVRYRHRHTDSSYESAASYKLGHPTGEVSNISAPAAMSTPAIPSNCNTISAPVTPGLYNNATPEDDTTGLLGHSARPGRAHESPPRSPVNDEYAGHAPVDRTPQYNPFPQPPPAQNVWQHDTSYRDTNPPAMYAGRLQDQWARVEARERREEAEGMPPSWETGGSQPSHRTVAEGRDRNDHGWI